MYLKLQIAQIYFQQLHPRTAGNIAEITVLGSNGIVYKYSIKRRERVHVPNMEKASLQTRLSLPACVAHPPLERVELCAWIDEILISLPPNVRFAVRFAC